MRTFAIIVLIACVSCMEMHETVERMVMVRTTGSDLQPAATGFIYKKDSDGPASVIKMGESEVMEHLSKIYEQPKSFTAPIPVVAGPFYAKNDDEKSAALLSESKIIPVVENQEEKDDHIDGIANEDYSKILEEYASDFGNYKSDFDDYLKSLEYFKNKNNPEHGDEEYYHARKNQDQDDLGKKHYGIKHQYNKENAGDYSSAKYETYQVSKGDGDLKDQNEDDSHGKHYADGHDYKRNYDFHPGYIQDKAVNEYNKYFDSDLFAKNQHSHDGEAIKGTHNKFSEGHAYNGPDAYRFVKKEAYNSKSDEADDKQSQEENDDDKHTGEKDNKPSQQYHNEFSFESGKHDGRSYGYEIKH